VKDEHGISREIAEKAIVYWSENFARRGEKENKPFLGFLDRFMESPESFRITAAQAKSLREFMDKNMVNKKTGEAINSHGLRAFIDKEKVAAYRLDFGHYQPVTSESATPDKEVIEKCHGLSQIENRFRIMKGALGTRPLFVRNPEHVRAHLLVCMIALAVMRIIQNRIVKPGLVPSAGQKELSWTMGLSGERIQRARNKQQADLMPQDLYGSSNTNDPDLKLVLDASSINIPPKFYRRAELRGIKTGIQDFMQTQIVDANPQNPKTQPPSHKSVVTGTFTFLPGWVFRSTSGKLGGGAKRTGRYPSRRTLRRATCIFRATRRGKAA
jgi:hypothetical protein